MAETKQLESIICEQIKSVKDTDTLVKLMNLGRVMLEKSNYKVGRRAVETIGEYLAHRVGEVGALGQKIV